MKDLETASERLVADLREALGESGLVNRAETLLFLLAERNRILEWDISQLQQKATKLQPSTFGPPARISTITGGTPRRPLPWPRPLEDGEARTSRHWAELIVQQFLPAWVEAQADRESFRSFRRAQVIDWFDEVGLPNEADRQMDARGMEAWHSIITIALKTVSRAGYIRKSVSHYYQIADFSRLLEEGLLKAQQASACPSDAP